MSTPKLKLMLSADVLVDFLTRGTDYQNTSLLMILCRVNEFEGLIAASDAAAVMDALRAHGHEESAVTAAFERLREVLHVAPLGENEFDQAIRESQQLGCAFSQALTEAACVSVRANALISETPTRFAGKHVQVISPSGLFQRLRDQYGLNYELIDW